MKDLIERSKNNVIVEKINNKTYQVAIIGIAARLGGADNIQEFWENIRSGKDCIIELPENRKMDVLRIQKIYRDTNCKYKKMGYLSDIDKFDYSFFGISKKEANLMDPCHRLFLETTWKAIEDAGYEGDHIKGSKTGIYVGHPGASQYKKLINEFEPDFSGIAASGNLPSMIAGRVSYILNLKGPSMLIDTACSSGLVAIHNACLGLKNGDCTMAIAGGVRISLNPVKNSVNDGISSKDEKAKTFDDSSDGTGSGEGVVSLILKPLEKALDDRDNIYAVIKGSAINQDGSSVGITAPNPVAQEEVIVKAWQNADVDPNTISYIEAHGTGTKLGDPIEIAGITGAFGRYTKRKQFCAIGSLKTNIGHLDSLAGLAGLVKAMLALKHGEIPPSLHFNLPNRNIDFVNSPVYVCDHLQKWRTEKGPRRCGVSAFGLSGTNCHVVLEEAPCRHIISDRILDKRYLLTISAKTERSRDQLIQSYCNFLVSNREVSIADMCYTSNVGREHLRYRVAIVAEYLESLYQKINGLCRANWTEQCKDDSIYFNSSDEQTVDMDSLTAEMTVAVKEYSLGNTEVLNHIAWLYAKGVDINFMQMYVGSFYKKISLPTYPFQQTRCWIDIPEEIKSNMEENCTYQTQWYEDKVEELEQKSLLGNVLLFEDGQGKGKALAEKLREFGTHVIEVQIGDSFCKIDSQHYEISVEESSYKKLFDSLSEVEFSYVIHTMSMCKNVFTNITEFNPNYENGLFSVMHITKCIGRLKRKIAFIVVSNYGNRVTGEEDVLYPMNAMLFGWTKAIHFEYKNIQVSCIDIDTITSMDSIIKELELFNHEHLVAYRCNKRYVMRVEQIDLAQIEERDVKIKENGVYIVTGGNGKVGSQVCRYLASQNKVNIISLNRNLGNIENDDSNTKFIQKIKNSGSEINFISTDVTSYGSLKKSLQYIRDNYGHIDGVFHCAAKGVGRAGTKIAEETEHNLADFLGPKVQGTLMVYELTKMDQLDFIILFSSCITLSGGSSSGAYIAGNTFLDAFPDSINSKSITTINFPRLQLREEKNNDQDQLFSTMLMEHATSLLGKILCRRITRCIIGEINLEGQIIRILNHLPFRFGNEIECLINKREYKSIKGYEETNKNDIRVHEKEKEVNSKEARCIGETICKLLGLSDIDINDDFFELGGNSIFAIKLESDLEKYGFIISSEELYTYNTVKKMAAFVGKKDLHVTEPEIDYQEEKKEVSDVVAIDHIEPFNDIFYKSCFFNSLIPIVLYYEKDIRPIIINDICIYKKKNPLNKEYILDICYIAQKDILDIIRSIGIDVRTKERSESVLSDIINAIKHGNPVILWIDCFYASIRSDVYEKKHLAHTWLIYGYDIEGKIFNIIEHSIKENLYYKKKVVSFDELQEAYNGYLSLYQKKNNELSYYEFARTKDSKEIFTDCRVTYKSYLMLNKERILTGLELLYHFIEDFQEYVFSEEQLNKKIEVLVESMNDIINAKRIEQYRIEKLYSCKIGPYELINKILKNYQKIRGILVKYQYTRDYHKHFMEDSVLILKETYMKEIEYIRVMGIET